MLRSASNDKDTPNHRAANPHYNGDTEDVNIADLMDLTPVEVIKKRSEEMATYVIPDDLDVPKDKSNDLLSSLDDYISAIHKTKEFE